MVFPTILTFYMLIFNNSSCTVGLSYNMESKGMLTVIFRHQNKLYGLRCVMSVFLGKLVVNMYIQCFNSPLSKTD